VRKWIRRALFSVLWDLGDWALRTSLRLDDGPLMSRAEVEQAGPWLIDPATTNTANTTTTQVRWFK
jgi:hypothetical protein